jgi:hypothetical protein
LVSNVHKKKHNSSGEAFKEENILYTNKLCTLN